MYRLVAGPSVWKRTDFRSDADWTRLLDKDELCELDSAAQRVKPHGIEPEEVRTNLCNPSALTATMRGVRGDLLEGRGFCVLRGVGVEGYGVSALEFVCWQLGAHLGEIIPQNADGDLLRYVTDIGDDSIYGENGPRAPSHRGSAPMLPHSDSSDIVALFCVRQAKTGGGNTVCSSMRIHNEILHKYPEYLQPLYEGFYFDLTGKTKDGDSITHQRIPVFNFSGSRASCTFNKSRIEVGMKKVGMPLNNLQQAAVNYLNHLAMHEEFAIPLRLLPGDILLLNNQCTLHAREAYEDWPEPNRKRLMLRLWLTVSRAGCLPDDRQSRS